MVLLHLADISLFLFHAALVVFNAVGWAWQRTRKAHLATLAITAASWFVLGLWFGSGYCVCTDLHWRVRAALGEKVSESTYVQYLVGRLTGWTPDARLAVNATAIVFCMAVVLSVWLNLLDRKRPTSA